MGNKLSFIKFFYLLLVTLLKKIRPFSDFTFKSEVLWFFSQGLWKRIFLDCLVKVHDNSFQTPYSVSVGNFFEVKFQLIMMWAVHGYTRGHKSINIWSCYLKRVWGVLLTLYFVRPFSALPEFLSVSKTFCMFIKKPPLKKGNISKLWRCIFGWEMGKTCVSATKLFSVCHTFL